MCTVTIGLVLSRALLDFRLCCRCLGIQNNFDTGPHTLCSRSCLGEILEVVTPELGLEDRVVVAGEERRKPILVWKEGWSQSLDLGNWVMSGKEIKDEGL